MANIIIGSAPQVFHLPLGLPAFCASEVLECCKVLKSQREISEKVRDSTNFSSFVVDEKIVRNLDSGLPNQDDTNFFEYIKRVTQQFDAKEFSYIINNFQIVCPNYFQEILNWLLPRTTNEISSLISKRITDNHGIMLTAIFGHYSIGVNHIHRDPNNNFTIPIIGKKEMLLWPKEPITNNPSGHLNGEIKDMAKLKLEASQGDLMFWPHTWWHCAGNKNATLVASLVLGVVDKNGKRSTLRRLPAFSD